MSHPSHPLSPRLGRGRVQKPWHSLQAVWRTPQHSPHSESKNLWHSLQAVLRTPQHSLKLSSNPRGTEQGSALVAVLWLTAALATIAFALAVNVRGEVERASTTSDGLRAYYLATGSITRALLWIEWGAQYKTSSGQTMFYEAPMPRLTYNYPTGIAVVELIPESSKLNVNTATPQQLYRLLLAMGEPEPRARLVADAIIDWRKPPQDGAGRFDNEYQASSFLAPHASIQQLEELLLVRGMSPELFYGYYAPAPDGLRVWHGGLRECLTVLGAQGAVFDLNSVSAAVLASFGASPDSINQLLRLRNRGPIRAITDVQGLFSEETMSHLSVGGGGALTLRATARVRLPNGGFSDLKRTVSALVRLPSSATGAPLPDPRHPYTIVRWYDNDISEMLPLLPPVRKGDHLVQAFDPDKSDDNGQANQ